MTANGWPAESYPLERRGIQLDYALAFEELQAAAALGMTWPEYEALPGAPVWIDALQPTLSKADVVAWFRLSGQLKAIDNAAAKRQRR